MPVSCKCVPSHLSWEMKAGGMCRWSFSYVSVMGHRGLGWRGFFGLTWLMVWYFDMLLDLSAHQASSMTLSIPSNLISSHCTWFYERPLVVKVFWGFLWHGSFLHRLFFSQSLGGVGERPWLYESTKDLLLVEDACLFWTTFVWIYITLLWFIEAELRWKVILYQVVFIFCLPILAALLICIWLWKALVFSEKSREKRRIYLRISLGSQHV